MKRFRPLVCLLGLLLAGAVEAVAQEDLYIKIFNTIMAADSQREKGQGRAALEKYLEAREELQKLKSAYKTWNTKIVDFRLRYLDSMIGPLQVQYPGTAIPPRVIPANEKDDGSPVKPAGPALALRNTSEQMIDSRVEIATLQEQLKEALAARPAPQDPAEYQKAMARIQELQRDNDLKQVTLEQQTRELAGLRKDFEKMQVEMARLGARDDSGALRAENAALRQQIDQLTKSMTGQAGTDEARRRLSLVEADLKTEQARVEALALDNQRLNRELAVVNAPELKAENDRLKLQIADLSKIAGKVGSVETLTQSASLMQAELNAQKALNEDLKSQNRKLEDQVRLNEVGALKSANEGLQKQVAELGKLAASMPDIKGLENQVAALQAQVQAEKSRRDSAERDRLKLEALLKDPNSPLGIPQEQYTAMEKKSRDLEAQVKALTAQMEKSAAAEAQLKTLQKEQQELQRRLDEATKELQKEKERKTSSLRQEAAARQAATQARDNARAAEAAVQKVAVVRTEVTAAAPAPVAAGETAVATASSPAPQPAPAPAPTPAPAPQPKREFPATAADIALAAQKAYNEQRYGEAEQKYQQVLAMEKDNVFTLANLAAAQMEQSKLAEAEGNLDKALKLHADDAFSLALMGLVKFRQNNNDAALEALSRAATLDPTNAQTQNYLGLALNQKGLRIAAEAAFRKAVKLSPGYGVAHYNLAVFYATAEPPSPELARWHYQKALSTGHPKSDELEKLIVAR